MSSLNTASAAFEFLALLARELSEGKVELPGFPHIFARVCRALNDPQITAHKMAAMIGAEPGLAARIMARANSVAFNPSSQPVGELPAAIVRLGDVNVRSVACAFAVAQMRHGESLRSVASDLGALWEISTQVAAVAYVVATTSRLNPDQAFLAGLMHGIGKLYIFARMAQQGEAFTSAAQIRDVTDGWQAGIGKSLLENWDFPANIVEAVDEQDHQSRRPHAPADIADAIICAKQISLNAKDAEALGWHIQNNRAFAQLGLDAPRCAAIVLEANAELGAMRAALGA